MRHRTLAAGAALCLSLAATGAHALPPAAIYADPPADAAHPARMDVLHIPSGKVELNAIAYVASGAGPHPAVVLFHGLPGNEKNLDLAQAMRRAGWTVVAPNYRGSWGSPGTFSFKGNLDDAKAVLAYLRRPAVAAQLGIDTRRIVVMGHSMGGWVTAVTGGSDPDLAGAVLISAADMGARSKVPIDTVTARLKTEMETLAGVTPESEAREIQTLGAFTFAAAAPGLAKHPLLVVTSNDGLQPVDDKLVMDVKQRGGRVAVVHLPTDHSYSDARIGLEAAVVDWLERLKQP